MGRPMQVSATAVVAAPPQEVWAAVADPTQMGRWSPENTGARTGAAGPLPVGAEFTGSNRRGGVAWVTRCTVTASDPGQRFAFRVGAIGARTPRLRAPIATWEYRFAPTDDGGTRVTETWTDDRRHWPDLLAGAFDRVVTRGSTFAAFQQRNVEATLRGLQRELGA